MAVSFNSVTSPFGTLTGWECQSVTPTTTQSRSGQLGSTGDEIASKTYGEQTSVQATYTLKTAASCKIPTYGEILNKYHIDNVVIQFSNTAFVQMTVTGHSHGTTTHTASDTTYRTYASPFSAPTSNWGCPSTVVGVTVGSATGIRSVTYTMSGTHTDEPNSTGGWLAGGDNDAVATVDCEVTDSAELSPATGWDYSTKSTPTTNTGVGTSSISVEKHITATAKASS